MVTLLDGKLVGLSSDEKPLGYDNGFSFEEIDTGKIYRYDAGGKVWICPSTHVVSIEVISPPNKLGYYEGEIFSDSGMVVAVVYGDGSIKKAIGYDIKPSGKLKATDKYVTISYCNKTVKLPIVVTPNAVESVSVITAPTKTAYKAGDVLTMAGVVLAVTYNNQSVTTIGYGAEGLVYSPEEGTPVVTSGNVIINYSGKSCMQAITYS